MATKKEMKVVCFHSKVYLMTLAWGGKDSLLQWTVLRPCLPGGIRVSIPRFSKPLDLVHGRIWLLLLRGENLGYGHIDDWGRLRPWVPGWGLEVLTTHQLPGPPEPLRCPSHV